MWRVSFIKYGSKNKPGCAMSWTVRLWTVRLWIDFELN